MGSASRMGACMPFGIRTATAASRVARPPPMTLAPRSRAHPHKALGGMDSKLVATQEDYTAVNAALGKVIASVPSSQVMDVYNSFSKLVSGSVPNKLFSTVNPLEAARAYDGLISFTNTVKAAQR